MSDDDPDSLTKDPATNVRLGVGFLAAHFSNVALVRSDAITSNHPG